LARFFVQNATPHWGANLLRFDLENLYFEVNPQQIYGKGWREFEGQTSRKPRIDLQMRYFYFPVSGYYKII
jgi:hypothetical protein